MRCKEQIRLYKYLFQELKKRGGISDEGKEERGRDGEEGEGEGEGGRETETETETER